MKIFVLAVVLLTCGSAPWGAERAGAQGVGDSCLVPWQDSPLFPGPGYGWGNPDSVKVDMCQGPQYLQEFAKDDFVVYFRYYIIPVTDSIALKGEDTAPHAWQDIDTAYSSLRDSFSRLEQRFGAFTIHHIFVGHGDTSDVVNKAWIINFNTYLNVDTVDTAISRLPDIYKLTSEGGGQLWGSGFGGEPSFWESVNENTSLIDIRIWPEPSSSVVHVSGTGISPKVKFFDPLGRELTLPTVLSDSILTVSVTNQPDGVIYLSVLGYFQKILIQH